MQPILSVKELSIRFRGEGGDGFFLNKVSFSIYKGETLGIVGESGSGKSLSSLAILGLVKSPPAVFESGKILFYPDEKSVLNLLQLKEKEWLKIRGRKIAMIFQEPMTSLNPVITCGRQVSESLILHENLSQKEARVRSIELFDEVQLPCPDEIFGSYPHQLSGGQKQRVMIAMAISCKPALLIADEPTTALDVTVQKTILYLLKNLQQKYGMAILFISHDLRVVAQIADRMAVMYQGNIVETGPVRETLKNPTSEYTRAMIACMPKASEKIKRLPVISDFLKDTSNKSIPKKPGLDKENDPLVRKWGRDLKTHSHYIEPPDPILEVRNLKVYFSSSNSLFSKSRSEVKAVDRVSFDVFEGETLGLVGESGCGKTTLGRSIIRLVESTDGSVIYKGQPISQLSNNEMRLLRRKMQIIFQDPFSSLNPRMCVGEAINEAIMVHRIARSAKEGKKRVEQILEQTGLEAGFYYRYPHEFSGGQRQRIGIARALALEPEFIICDESVSALDVSVQAQVLNLLNDLKEEYGLTYIFISHDLNVVQYMSDRIIVMNQGKIEEMGNTREVCENPTSGYTRSLLASIPVELD